MKILYFVRHGQTFFNAHHKIQGVCDSPLTELGIRQAQAVHDYFENHHIKFNRAFCSTQERASDTLEIITDHQMPYIRLKEMREKSHGMYEGQDEYMLPWRRGFSRNNPAFEADSHVEERMEDAVRKIIADTQDGDRILVVGHGTILRLFTKHINPEFESYSNCEIVKMYYKDNKLKYIADAEPASKVE